VAIRRTGISDREIVAKRELPRDEAFSIGTAVGVFHRAVKFFTAIHVHLLKKPRKT
jgi:hypothetical protein